MKLLTKRVFTAFSLVISIVLIGMSGYHFLEKWSWVDSFFVTAMTISGAGTQGYMPQTDMGKVFAGVLSVFSIGVVVGLVALLFQPLAKELFVAIKGVSETPKGRKRSRV